MWQLAQKENDIAKSKQDSRPACASMCHSNAECVGFEYNPTTKDCHLTKLKWREMSPTSMSNTWTCEKKEGRQFN